MAKTSTNLNFPGQTEEVFIFYRSIFGGEFCGGGIMRFGDIPPQEGMPPMAEEVKNLVMHIELPILGGHLLMGSDAPESMGFQVQFGNNVYLNLDADTREETSRIFNALSNGGKIEMDLQDVFWGAYFGSCSDKYGINWMVYCNVKP